MMAVANRAGILASFKASFGTKRAKDDTCRTAGRLWMALLPKGKFLRRGHLELARRTAEVRERAVCDIDCEVASALLW